MIYHYVGLPIFCVIVPLLPELPRRSSHSGLLPLVVRSRDQFLAPSTPGIH